MTDKPTDAAMIKAYLVKQHKNWQIEFGRITPIGPPADKTIAEIEEAINALDRLASLTPTNAQETLNGQPTAKREASLNEFVNSTVSRTLAADTIALFGAENSTAGRLSGQQEVTPQVDTTSLTPTNVPVRDLYYEGIQDGRKQEHEHCNAVVKKFFDTFKLGKEANIDLAEKHNKLDDILSDAMDCLKGETPEDMTKHQATELIIERIQRYLRYGDFE